MLKNCKIKDPGSALTHFIAMLLTAAAAVPLLHRALFSGKNILHFSSLLIFICSMFLLYTASTVYHTFNISARVNRVLRKIDHIMIYIFIAGSYTPICLAVLSPDKGLPLLTAVWGIALLGILINAFWITCPRWLSSLIYIAMGWFCVSALREIFAALPRQGFLWLLFGGIIYTVGGVIYALKLKTFNERRPCFGSHEIFHLFVMGGSLCHYVLMYTCVA